ncbi:MAG: cysteine synthase A [Syntrophomonadaceae bacterium]|nr:cysteine synthase A [Syntrophomonadaceae bacterium]
MKVVGSVLELIGGTPVLRLDRMRGKDDAEVYVKLEGFNPGGSVKDRPALVMIEEAERAGQINKNTVIVEATSGNTGIGLAMVAAVKGYPIIIIMPENMSEERKKILQAYGAKLVLTPANEGVRGALRRAEEMVAANPNYFMPQQFANPANPLSHERATAREILEQVGTDISVFVAGVGSGGTITGVAQALKKTIPDLKVVAVEPFDSSILSGELPGTHKIQGIGAGFIPEALRMELIDKIFRVKDEEAINTARLMARKEGILVGISTGAAVFCALRLAKKLGRKKKIVTIAPDGGDKYFSTELFSF